MQLVVQHSDKNQSIAQMILRRVHEENKTEVHYLSGCGRMWVTVGP
jgi:hypothetical protein